MSIDLSTETKSTTVIKKERTWRTEMFTESGKDYLLHAHREILVSIDGEFSHKEKPQVEEATATFTELVSMDDIVSYKDKTGTTKTIPLSDIAFLFPEALEILVAKRKSEIVITPTTAPEEEE